jgi:hypothetical protein
MLVTFWGVHAASIFRVSSALNVMPSCAFEMLAKLPTSTWYNKPRAEPISALYINFSIRNAVFKGEQTYNRTFHHIASTKQDIINLQADRTTLCARTLVPSHISVTSTSVSLCSRVSNAFRIWFWWLFHRKL